MARHRVRGALLVLAMAGGLAILGSCKGTEPDTVAQAECHVVKVEGTAVCYNYTLAPFSWMTSDGTRPAGLLARDGDVLVFATTDKDDKVSDTHMLVYREADGDSLTLAFESGRLLLGGKTVSLLLDAPTTNAEAAWEWLEQASEEDLKSLRLLHIGKEVDAAQMEILKRVAAASPAVDLMLEGDESSAAAQREILRLFRPRFLFTDARLFSPTLETIRPALRNVEVLILDNLDGASLDFLTDLPRLRFLLLSDWSPETSPLPPEMANLKSLCLGGAESPADLAPLADLTQLEELVFMRSNANDLGALAALPKLRVLSLVACQGAVDLSPLEDLPLEYLAFPPEISQEQFDAAVKAHPGLKAVELYNCENIQDISCLKGLADLEALLLIGKTFEGKTPLAGLKEMKNLRLLVLPPWEGEEAEAEVSELQKALPDCLISTGKPMCLGSGWILALVPVAAGVWLITRRRRAKPY